MLNIFKVNKNKIKAVHEEDFINYLKSIGLYDEVISKNKNCIICGDVLNIEDIQLVLPLKEKISLVCKKRGCVKKSSEKII